MKRNIERTSINYAESNQTVLFFLIFSLSCNLARAEASVFALLDRVGVEENQSYICQARPGQTWMCVKNGLN